MPGRAYDLLGAGHLAASLDGVLLRVNPGLAAMLGHGSPDDLLLDCEGRAVALWEEPGEWEAFASLVEMRGGLARYPAVLRCRNGSYLPCAAWGRLVQWPGAKGRVLEAVFQSEAESHQAFAALTQVLNLHREMMDLNPDPVLIHQEGCILLANPAAESFFKSQERGSLAGRRISELLHPSSGAKVRCRFLPPARSLPRSGEFHLVLADGEECWVRGFNAAITFHGQPAVLTLLHDRTGRHRDEAARNVAEFLYRSIADTVSDPVFIHMDGRIQYANPATALFTGMPGSEPLAGRRVRELFHPSSHALLLRRHAQVLAAEGISEAAYEVVLRDGTVKQVKTRSLKLEYLGRTAVLSMLYDQTDLLQAEQAQAEAERLYRDVLENMPASVCLHDDGRILYANPCMRRQFAPGETGDISGRHFLDFIHPDSHAVYHRRRDEVLAGQPDSAGGYALRYADGRLRHLADTTIAVNIGGRPVFLAIVQDMTGQVAAEQARDEAETIYQAMVENSPSPMCIVEPGRHLVANQALADFYQVGEVATLLASTLDDLMDEESVARIRAASAEVLKGGEVSNRTASIRLRSGEVRHCHSVAVPIRYQGRTCMLVTMRDLTAHHVAQQALAEAEALYRTLVETMPDPLFIHEKGVILYANPAAVAFLGRSGPQGCVGQRLEDMLPPESRAVLADRLRTVLAYPGGSEAEYALTMPGGVVRHIHTRSTGVEYQGRSATVVLFHDLTERNLCMSERDLAQARHEDLFQFAPLGIGVGLRSGRLERVNPHLATMFGYASPAAMVAEIKDILSDMFADPADCIRLRRLAEEQGALLDFECLAKRRDGSLFWTSRNVRVVRGPGGEVLGYEGFIRDISAHRQAEAERDRALARHEALFQLAPMGIALALPDGRMTRVNRRMAKMFGYASPEAMVAEVQDIPAQLFADPEDYWRLRRLAEREGEVNDFECLGRRRDGSEFWVSRSVRAVTGPDGTLEGFEAFVRDIDARRKATEEAREHGRRVQALRAELAMAGERERRTLAHDLHDGPVQLLALATLMIDDLARSGKRGSRFAPALDLLRQAADQFRLALDDLAPPAVLGDGLAEALRALGRDFQSRYGLELEVACPELPTLTREAVSFLYRAARELLVNAIKHGRASRVAIRVEVEAHLLRLMVEDHGLGFTPALFWDGNVRSLGLPSLRNLARDLGGGMAVDSAPGAGTRVVLVLPLESLCDASPGRETFPGHA